MNRLNGILAPLIVAAVLAGAGSVSGVVLLSWRADASEEKVKEIDDRQRALETNQAVLTRDVAWSAEMLKKLLESRRIPVPAPPPLPVIREAP